MTPQKRNHLSNRSVITNYLRNAEQRRFKGSRPRSNQSRIRVLQQTISLTKNNFHLRLSYILFVIFRSNGRSASQNKLVAGESRSRLQHIRQVIFYLLFSASCQKCNNRFILQLIIRNKLSRIFRMRFLIGRHFIHRRIPHIMDRIVMLSFKELHFKRKNGEQLVHITLYILDAVFFPSPYLRRYIIIYGNLRLCVDKLGDIQIESRIIYQNDNIRIPGNDIFLATSHIGKDSTQMEQHRNKSHISQLLIMFHHRTAYGSHQITAEKTKFSLRIFHLQSCHQMRSVQVTGGFAHNQIILHRVES